MGKCCVAGAEGIHVDVEKRIAIVGDTSFKEGDMITLDGTSGKVYLGEIPTVEPEFTDELVTLLTWADEVARIKVMANLGSGARLIAAPAQDARVYYPRDSCPRALLSQHHSSRVTHVSGLVRLAYQRPERQSRPFVRSRFMFAITVEIPDDLAANFDTPEAIRRTLFEDFVIEQRQRGTISLGKAAELLGLSYPELLDLLGGKGLSPINASPQDLDESYRRFVELVDKA